MQLGKDIGGRIKSEIVSFLRHFFRRHPLLRGTVGVGVENVLRSIRSSELFDAPLFLHLVTFIPGIFSADYPLQLAARFNSLTQISLYEDDSQAVRNDEARNRALRWKVHFSHYRVYVFVEFIK